MVRAYGANAVSFAALKFQSLGLEENDGLQALLKVVRSGSHLARGAEIVTPDTSSNCLTLLLDGVACSCKWLADGSRQIYAFHYSGDFCDLHRFVQPATAALAVVTLTNCAIGSIDFKELEKVIEQHPKLGTVLWRASMLEASVLRERLLNVSRRPALQRVAHLLCEQLARLETVGVKGRTLPLTQTDLADAAGMSVVHMSRTITDLRRLGVLSNNSRGIEVVNKKQLVRLAQFDGGYLNMPELLSQWNVNVET